MANEAKPTLHDVADEARVSIATVSRVVNGAANVRTQTRMRVEQAVSRLGYIPNPQARELRKCSTARARGPSMISAAISAAAGGQPEGSYVQARSITGFTQLLFVSGQVPVGRDGIAPDSFEQQAEVAWANVLAQLETAAMTPINLVKVTTYLARRTDKTPNREVRERILGDHLPALTVVIAEIFDADWLIEIETIAAK